jgi:tetratricopeptide (TPR) repeat protein
MTPAARTSITMEALQAPPASRSSAQTIPAPRDFDVQSGIVVCAGEEDSPLARASALRRAVAYSPGNPTLRRQLDLAQLAADRQQNERLCLEAEQARETGRYGEAVELFSRAARATRNAEMYLAAANCSVLADDNPRAAAELAKAGLAIAPDHAGLHSLLGRIYAGAGMVRSAVSELRKARHLNPSDEEAHALLRRLEKN